VWYIDLTKEAAMVNGIAQKLLNWIKETGPTLSGDAYNQERIDEVDDFLSGHAPCPASLAPGEEALAVANSDAISEAIWELMNLEAQA
jgi:hypothetical protein